MKSMNLNGKTYWLVDPWEQETVHERVSSLVGHKALHEGEHEFVEKMAKQSESRSFRLSNPQLMWLERILARVGMPSIHVPPGQMC